MDPSLLVAGISALLKAIDVWIRYRDSQRAEEAFRREQEEAPKTPQIQTEARALATIIPQDILDSLIARAERCWTGYKAVLEGRYLPDEVDDATEAVKSCICRELKRIDALGEPLPPGKLKTWQEKYCKG